MQPKHGQHAWRAYLHWTVERYWALLRSTVGHKGSMQIVHKFLAPARSREAPRAQGMYLCSKKCTAWCAFTKKNNGVHMPVS